TSLRASSLNPAPLLLGYRSDTQRLFRSLDVFVLNSFGEGMSNTLLEAMATGLPVICTAVGGNVEVVTNRHTGIVVSPGDDLALGEALCEYAHFADVRRLYGQNARRF